MTNKIIVVNVIITANPLSNDVLLLSTDKDKLILPSIEITNPKFLYDEIRGNIRNMFDDGVIKYLEEIVISFLDIQNPLLLNLIDSNRDIYEDINDSDIILLCGTILHKKLQTSSLNWKSIENTVLKQKIYSKTNGDIENIIKYVFEQMVI